MPPERTYIEVSLVAISLVRNSGGKEKGLMMISDTVAGPIGGNVQVSGNQKAKLHYLTHVATANQKLGQPAGGDFCSSTAVGG